MRVSRRCRSGPTLSFKNGNVSESPYGDIDTTRKCGGTFEEKTHRSLELFRDSVLICSIYVLSVPK